jgi:hypothetical protein
MGTQWGQKQIPRQVVTTTLWIQGWPSPPSLGIMQGIYNIPLHLVEPRSKEKVGSLGSWHDPWTHPQSIDMVVQCVSYLPESCPPFWPTQWEDISHNLKNDGKVIVGMEVGNLEHQDCIMLSSSSLQFPLEIDEEQFSDHICHASLIEDEKRTMYINPIWRFHWKWSKNKFFHFFYLQGGDAIATIVECSL